MALFGLVITIFWFALYVYVPILPSYVAHLGGSLKVVGLVVGSYGFVQMLLRIPLGLWSDGIGKRKGFITLGILLALASSLLMGLWPSVGIMLLGRALSGAAAATWVTFTVLFSSRFSSEDAPKAMGLAVFYSNLGQILATLIGGHIAELYGWHAPFVLGAVCALAGVLLSLGIRETRQVKRERVQLSQLLAVGRERDLLIVSGLAILVQYMTFATMYGFTPIYAEGIGADAAQLSLLTFWSTLPMAAAALASGSGLASRLGTKRIVTAGFVLGALAAAVVPFAKTLPQLYITQAIGSLGRGAVFPLVMGMSIQTVSEEKRATAMGFFQAIYSLGMFGGPIIVGIIGDISGLAGGFLSTGAVGLLGSLLAWRLLPAPGIQARQAPHQMGAAGKQ
jgi:MFS family permease